MHDNMCVYFNDVLPKFRCSFGKDFGAQNCLLGTDKLSDRDYTKNCANCGVFAAVMTDLSKAFDRISHEILMVKLNGYDFDETSLKVIFAYLKNRMQTAKVG